MLQTNLLLQKLGREITVITCDSVMVLALCIFFDDVLSKYPVLFNSLLYFQRYAPDKLNIAEIRRVIVLAFCDSPHGPLSVYQVSFHSLVYFQRYATDKFLLQKLKGK